MMGDVVNCLMCAFQVPVKHSRVKTLAGFWTNAAHLELCQRSLAKGVTLSGYLFLQLKQVDFLYRGKNWRRFPEIGGLQIGTVKEVGVWWDSCEDALQYSTDMMGHREVTLMRVEGIAVHWEYSQDVRLWFIYWTTWQMPNQEALQAVPDQNEIFQMYSFAQLQCGT